MDMLEERRFQLDEEDDDDEDMDETVGERLIGLTEMFPDSFRRFFGAIIQGSYSATKGLISLTRGGLWIAVTTSTVMMLPYVIERERLDVEQMQQLQQKQILLGPGVVAAQHQVGSSGLGGHK